MGYSKVIAPKDNFEKFRTTGSGLNLTKYIEKYVLYGCMAFNKDGKEVKEMDISTYLFNLEKWVDNLIENYKYDEKVALTKEFDSEEGSWKKKGELVFCGWEYAKNERDIDLEDTKEYVLEKLFVLGTLVKNYDYYEEGEMFCKKQNEVEDLLEYLRDEVHKSVDFEVINYYKDDEVDDEDEENCQDIDDPEDEKPDSYYIKKSNSYSFDCLNSNEMNVSDIKSDELGVDVAQFAEATPVSSSKKKKKDIEVAEDAQSVAPAVPEPSVPEPGSNE